MTGVLIVQDTFEREGDCGVEEDELCVDDVFSFGLRMFEGSG